MGSAQVDAPGLKTDEVSWVSYAHWVRDALGLIRSGAPGKIGLFESSVREPTAMLADTVSQAFRHGVPASYQSVFMRSNPDLAVRLSERYAMPVRNIHCTTGATSAVQLAYPALLNRGDQVLVERPGFDIFANYADDAGMETAFFERKAPHFSLSTDMVLQQLTSRTRMVVVSNLHNPSGALVPDDELARLAEALRKRDVYLLVDEVYRDYHERAVPGLDPEQYPNVVRIGSMTKIFGLSTLRCGWLFAAGETMARLKAHCDRVDFSVSKFSHSVAAEVLARAPAYDAWRVGHMETARPIAEAAFEDMAARKLIEIALPVEGCTCFPKVVGIGDTMALSRWLIARHGVVVVPGECFGMAGHVRIGYALEEAELRKGLERLAAGLSEYQQKYAESQRIA
ncbi:pyridoxal phosphate-dependent aminotransferase [Henriciella aquimarina]|uniref:pyridoxal phosphate-dependent aminotransferase n=1 Tax=Henriciella aquimarina TaxID=545261 RepID=UPI001301B42E|nr:pyridoxal phosphate-dependent aminotransferase [Henriciella aquimarina]